jgi:hypothetical protein
MITIFINSLNEDETCTFLLNTEGESRFLMIGKIQDKHWSAVIT